MTKQKTKEFTEEDLKSMFAGMEKKDVNIIKMIYSAWVNLCITGTIVFLSSWALVWSAKLFFGLF